MLEGVVTSAEVLPTPNPSQEGNRTPQNPYKIRARGDQVRIRSYSPNHEIRPFDTH